MKKSLLILCAVFVCIQSSSFALSLKNITNAAVNTAVNAAASSKTVQAGAKNNASIASQLSSLDSELSSADKNVQNSFLSLVQMLSTDKEADLIESKVSSIMQDASKTETEKSSLMSQIISGYASSLAADKKNAAQTVSNMKSAEKAALSNAVSSLSESGAKYASLAKNYASLTAAASSASELAENIDAVKKGLTAVKSSASAVTSLVSAVSQILK